MEVDYRTEELYLLENDRIAILVTDMKYSSRTNHILRMSIEDFNKYLKTNLNDL